MRVFFEPDNLFHIFNSDVMDLYKLWESPVVIISDGPYGVAGFSGDLPTSDGLAEWYEPHIKAWAEQSTPQTTLWFWCTEIGWATVHPVLDKYGWEYRSCHNWDKGIAHVAGNANTKTLRKLPVVTEVCIQYVKRAIFPTESGQLSMQEWLRYEWMRSGLPLSKTNEACGVKNAATRKYFTKDHLWYFPPPKAFKQLVKYANKHGNNDGKPYFSVNGATPLTEEEWEAYRAKFYCPVGVTNVWREAPVNGKERIKNGTKAVHANQKPISLMKLIISLSSDKNDLIWEPFGGLCTATLAAYQLGRKSLAAEIDPLIYDAAIKRFSEHQRELI